MPGVPLSPLTGTLDTRSLPNAVAQGGVRWRQNFNVSEEGKLCRGFGWEKLRNTGSYNNPDLHDQLLTFRGGGAVRQPLVYLEEIESSRHIRRLFAGTQDALFRLNEYTGNWTVLGSGYGSSTVGASKYRWRSAKLGDYVIFTNNFNKVLAHTMEESSGGGAALNTIADLDVIGLTRAGVVWEWKNCIFLADVEMDGERFSHKLIWSDYQGPISFDPSKVESIAGSQDLNLQERILAGAPAGNSFLIYTTHGIWEMTAVGGAQSFAFRRVYNADEEQQRCLFYPFTLVNLGNAHAFLGKDRAYIFSQYYQQPEAVKWLDKASGSLFENIDATACNSHIGFYDGDNLFFSVAKVGDALQCPSLTLRANMKFEVADYLDAGFTALAGYRPGNFQTIRDFLLDNKICTAAGLQANGYGFVNEGLPNPFPAASAPFIPQSIHTSHPITVAGVTTEDYTQVGSDSDSLCAILAGKHFEDLCPGCIVAPLVVAASSVDWCLKQLTNTLYRERCTNVTAVGTTASLGYTSSAGVYVLDGYDSILRWPPAVTQDALILATLFKVDYLSTPQDVPSNLQLRIGLSSQIADPNTDQCCLVWHQMSNKLLKCLSPSSAATHLTNGTVPNLECRWKFQYKARFVYFEMKISGTGGGACFSGLEAILAAIPTKNY